MIPTALKRKILATLGGGALAVAAVLVTWHEGISYVPYADPGNGTLTVCYGHTGPDIIKYKRYTPEECKALLNKDLAIAEAAVDRQVKVPLTEAEKAALIDYTFNLGEGNLRTSTLLRKLNAKDYTGACGEYHKWVKAGGRVLPGLVNRREADTWVCEGAK